MPPRPHCQQVPLCSSRQSRCAARLRSGALCSARVASCFRRAPGALQSFDTKRTSCVRRGRAVAAVGPAVNLHYSCLVLHQVCTDSESYNDNFVPMLRGYGIVAYASWQRTCRNMAVPPLVRSAGSALAHCGRRVCRAPVHRVGRLGVRRRSWGGGRGSTPERRTCRHGARTLQCNRGKQSGR